MKQYVIIVGADGNRVTHEVADGLKLNLQKGDRISVADANGNPLSPELDVSGNDLILNFGGQDKGAQQVTLKGFNAFADGDIDLAMAGSPNQVREAMAQNELFEWGDKYDVNPALGNLPMGDDFTLMRFSNVGSVEIIDDLNAFRDEVRAALRPGQIADDRYSPSGGAPLTDDFPGEGGDTIINRPTRIIRPPAVSNTAPNAQNDFAELNEDEGPVNISVLSNDTDREGPVNILAAASEVGEVTINPDGTISYDPPTDYNGTDTITYSIVDSDGNTDIATVTINVLPVNDAPIAIVDDAGSVGRDTFTSENAVLNINPLPNDFDPDGDPLEVISISSPPGGVAVLKTDGTVDWDPGTDYDYLQEGETATVEIPYVISDGSETAGATMVVTVEGSNDGPVANPDVVTVAEDTPTIVDPTGNDTDVDGDPLNVCGIEVGGTMITPTPGVPITLDSGAIVTLLADGTFSYDQNGVFDYLNDTESATDVFSYKIDDGNGGTATETVSVTITGEDDPTDVQPDVASGPEDSPITGNVLTNDSDVDDTLTVASNSPPTNGSVLVNPDGTFTYTPDPDFTGTDTFTYTTNTGASETVTITVDPVNDAPVANPDIATVTEDTPVTLDPTDNDTDVEGDPFNICGIEIGGVMTTPTPGVPITLDSGAIITVLADGKVIFEQNGVYDYLNDTETATDGFTYKIDDGNGGTATETVTVTISGTDDPTDVQPDVASGPEDTPIVGNVLTNDSDVDDPLTVALNSTPTNGTVLVNPDGTFTYTPDPDFTGTDTFTYTTNTGASETVTVTVDPVNDAPTAADDTVAGTEDVPLTLGVADLVTPNDTDPDGDPLTITGVSNPSNGTVVLNGDGTVTFTPDPDYNGPASFDYVVSDGSASDTATVTVNVAAVNDAPVAANDTVSGAEDTPLILGVADIVTPNDIDVDGDTLTITGVSNPSNGAVVLNGDGTVTFTPDPDYNGPASFDYVVSDGSASDTATVTVNVDAGNDAPVAADDTVAGTEDTPLILGVADLVTPNDTDPDGDPLTITGVSNASNGTAVLNGDGTVTFTPAPNYNGPATFDYVVSDGSASDTATVTVNVAAVNDAPVAVDDTVAGTEDTPLVLGVADIVTPNDTDLDGDTLTISGVNSPSNGTVVLNGDGTVTFTPTPGYSGPASFDYIVSDGEGGSDTATVTVNVANVNSDPTAVDDSYSCSGSSVPSLLTIDGTFEDLAGVASSDGFNSNVTGGGWQNGQGSADSWINMTTAGTGVWGGLADGMPASPDGGVFAAAGNWTAGGESFRTTLSDLTIGETYTIKFYQGNAGIEGTTPINEMTGWRVKFGTEEKFSTKMPYLGEGNQVWTEEAMTFTATATSQVLEFFADDDGDPLNAGASTEYMAVDGIRVEEGDTSADCSAFTSMNLVGNDTDPDSDPLTVSHIEGSSVTTGSTVTLTSGNTVTINPDGTVAFDQTTAPLAAGATETFEYTVSDGAGGTDTATVTLNGPEDIPEGTYGNLNIAFVIDESGSISGSEITQIQNGLDAFIANEVDSGNTISFIGMSVGDTDIRTDHIIEQEITSATQGTFDSWVSTYRDGTIDNNSDYWASGLSVVANDLSETPDIVVIIADGAQGVKATAEGYVSTLEGAGSHVFAIGVNSGSYYGETTLLQGVTNVLDPTPVETSETDMSDILTTDYDANADFAGLAASLSNLTAALEAAFAPPVAIDLDGDGVEFVSTEEGIEFDIDEDGADEQVAWAGNDDGVLIFDENNNDEVDDRSEFVFADYSENPDATDMEGLAEFFDTNGDGTLDAGDAQFASFKIWQDADGDGEVGDGEMKTLSEHGIESIGLTNDGESYSAADGDIYVHGESVVNYTDGSTGIAADAQFQYQELAVSPVEDESPIEIVSGQSGEVITMEQAAPAPIALEAADFGDPGAAAPTTSIDEQVAIDAAMAG